MRWKNKALWVSAAALVLLLLQAFGVGVNADQYNAVINTALSILVAAGILNNPTTENDWFGDDKKEEKNNDY